MRFLVSGASALIGIVLLSALAYANDEAAKLYSAHGVIERRADGAGEWQPLAVGAPIFDRDAVRTGAGSRAALVLNDGLMVRLNERSVFQVGLDGAGRPGTIRVDAGETHFFSRKEREFPTISTRYVSASIRGTELTVSAREDRSEVAVLAGRVRVENDRGGVDLGAGELARVSGSGAPEKSVLIDPVEAVQWALYYPATFARSDFPGFEDEIELVESGESERALKRLEAASPSPSRDLFRAAIALSRGQVAAAAALHTEVETQLGAGVATGESDVRAILAAQRAIIAVVWNRSGEALALAREAVAAAPNSVSGVLALSYALQAGGQVDAAWDTVVSAAAQLPESPTLSLRTAELALSRGESVVALRSAAAVADRSPRNSYAATVRGFAEIARLDMEAARRSFEQAIELSSGDGLPFLGLALTEIRRGDLVSGRTLLEKAAHLEPTRALYRSYLGKAFFENERETLAAEELARAIELDPNDPTPYLYRTFLHLSRNEPVKALDDIEASIRLNDNRAVYRSRLLLDQDASVRSSSLANVYTSLGFNEIARLEAIRSLARDYANYSAHLDLSQAYEESDDLLQASLSEFFVARLLSPVNFNLVRPSQAGGISANEYSAVFDRDQNRVAVELDGRTRDRSVIPGALFSGTSGRWGYALSYAPTYADGFRDNDKRNAHSTYGSLQYQLTPETSLLLDANLETFDDGDTDLAYDPFQNEVDQTSSFDDALVRLGFNHRFGPGSQLIGQVVGSHSNIRTDNAASDRPLLVFVTAGDQVLDSLALDGFVDQRIQFKSDNIRADIQHIFTSPWVTNVFGGGWFNGDQARDDEVTIAEPDDLAGVEFGANVDSSEGSRRLYDYVTFHLTPWLDLQGGVSYNHLRLSGTPLSVPFVDTVESLEGWDPKVGLVASLDEATTARAAFFESTGSAALRELEVIEPTLVSGFNQSFFNIFPGTSTRTLALGLDRKFVTRTYVGAEVARTAIKRNFPVSVSQLFFDLEQGGALTTDILAVDNDAHIDDRQWRGYLYQVFGTRFSGTADVLGETDRNNFTGAEIETERVRLGLNYFDPTGWFAFGRGTWRDQDIEGIKGAGEVEVSGDSFWLVDVGVGYRLPNRRGRLVFQLNNILDTDFRYQPTGFDPAILPGIGASVSASYNF